MHLERTRGRSYRGERVCNNNNWTQQRVILFPEEEEDSRPVEGSAPDLSAPPRAETPPMPLEREGVREPELELIPTTTGRGGVRSKMGGQIR